MSKFYDFLTGSSEREFTSVGIEQMDIKPGERILDLGCGTGFATAKIAEKVGSPAANPNASVIGVDISQGMLDQAKSRLEKEKLLDRATLLNCNALQLPFASNTFDGVLLSFVVELFDNEQIPALLAEVLRVLKPNGRVTFVCLVRKVEKISVRMYEWFHKKFPSVVDCRPLYMRETLAALSSLLKVTKHSEHTMWSLPVEVVTARKRTDDEVESIKKQLEDQEVRNSRGQQQHHFSQQQNHYKDLVKDVASEAARMIVMEKENGSASSGSSSVNNSFDANRKQQQQNQDQGGFGARSGGPRESVLGDVSVLLRSEFGEMKFKAVPRSQWMEDQQTDYCYLCKKEFGFFTRRHHCRYCGLVACSKCSEQKVAFTSGSKEKERVCDSCFEAMGVTETEM